MVLVTVNKVDIVIQLNVEIHISQKPTIMVSTKEPGRFILECFKDFGMCIQYRHYNIMLSLD